MYKTFEEIKKEAMQKARKEGELRGYRGFSLEIWMEGYEEGFEQGFWESRREMALELLNSGKYPLEEIAFYTELSIDEIQKLQVESVSA